MGNIIILGYPFKARLPAAVREMSPRSFFLRPERVAEIEPSLKRA